jgi:hypothetical protein
LRFAFLRSRNVLPERYAFHIFLPNDIADKDFQAPTGSEVGQTGLIISFDESLTLLRVAGDVVKLFPRSLLQTTISALWSAVPKSPSALLARYDSASAKEYQGRKELTHYLQAPTGSEVNFVPPHV